VILPLLLDLTEVDFFFNDCSPSEMIDTMCLLQNIKSYTKYISQVSKDQCFKCTLLLREDPITHL
jgi:hypothetical protein